MESKNNNRLAGYWIRRFLTEYLTGMRNLSVNTMHSYRDMIRLLMPFIGKIMRKSVDDILIDELSKERVIKFLDHLENDRNCSYQTRNQRLSGIVALAKYVAANSPEHIEWCQNIRSIPIKKGAKRVITYLEKEEMDALLALPDRKDTQGYRDYSLLLFLYNTGARAEEAANLTIGDLEIGYGSKLHFASITGKGRKTRRCPLWDNTCKALAVLTKDRKENESVFINRLGKPITRFGIYEMVVKYAATLAKVMPSIEKKRLTPHTIRHTTATHLLQAGVDINTIRAWLGHVSINTTNLYAEVNLKMKAAALLKYKVDDVSEKKPRWKDDRKLMDFLDNL